MTQRLEQLRKLHDADPADADVVYMIAMEHSKAGDDEQALEWLDKTIALDAHYHYAYFQKGKAFGALGRDSEARDAIQEGLNQANAAGDAKAAGELGELLASMTR